MNATVIPSLISGGLGAMLAAIIVAVIQTLGQRGKTRAHAADLIAHAAGEMVDRLHRDNKELRGAIILLTDALDIAMPLLDAPPEVLTKLRQAKNTAMRVV